MRTSEESYGITSHCRIDLPITYEFAINSLPLRLQVIPWNLVKAVDANAVCLVFLALANPRSAPDTLDQEVRLGSYFAFFHGVNLRDAHYDLISTSLNEG